VSGQVALADCDHVQVGDTVVTFHDLHHAMAPAGLICAVCRRENAATRMDCWYCGQDLVDAERLAAGHRQASCRLVADDGRLFDVFVGRGAGIRLDGGIEPLHNARTYAAYFDGFGDNLASVMAPDGVTREIPASTAIEAAGRRYLVLLP
jgi:hypothetical protein